MSIKIIETDDLTIQTNLSDFTPSACKKYRMVFELDTDFGPTSFHIDLTKFRDVSSDDFMTSHVDSKVLVNVLRVPLSDLHNIEIFKRSNIIFDFRSDGVCLKNSQDPNNTIFLRSRNLREYAYNSIRKISANSQSVVVDYHFLHSYLQILKKLKVNDLCLYLENKVKHSNGLKFHLIGDGESLLLMFVRKCKFDINPEVEFINMKKQEESNYNTNKKPADSYLFNNKYQVGDATIEVNTLEEPSRSEYQAKRIKQESLRQSDLYIAKDQIKDFKLQHNNKNQIIEEKSHPINEEDILFKKEDNNFRKNTFYQMMKEKSMSAGFGQDERKNNYEFGSSLKNLRCNQG